MDYLKRLEKFDKLEQKRFKKIYEINNRVLTKHANKYAKIRVMEIAQSLVLSNTISLEELTQLDIQYKTMSEICESIIKKFGKTRLEHLDNYIISLLSEMDDYESGELIDLSSITRKQLGKGSFVIIDLVKEKERQKNSKEKRKEMEKSFKERQKESKEKIKEMEKSLEELVEKMLDEARKFNKNL